MPRFTLRRWAGSRFSPEMTLAVAMIAGLTFETSAIQAQPPVVTDTPSTAQPSASDAAGDVTDQATEPVDEALPVAESDEVILPETVVTAPQFPREPLTDDTVVGSSKTPVIRRTVGSSVTVITEEDIRQRGARTLNDVLQTVPGLDVTPSGGPGQQTTIFTRGANGSQTRVLLDGIPLNDPSGPTRAFDSANFMLDNVERVEIIRGPQSSLYGSDAIGGVINIVTRRGTGPAQVRASFLGGSFGTFNQSTALSGGDERVWYSMSGSWFKNDGFSAVAGGTEQDGYENGTLSGRLGALLTDDFDVDVSWRYIDADVDIDGFGVDSPNNLDTEEFFLRTQAHYSQFDGRLNHQAGFSYATYRKDDRFGFQRYFDGESQKFDYQSSLLLIDEGDLRHTVVAGVEYLNEEFLQDTTSPFITFAPQARQFATGLFIENQFAINEQWFTTAGYRHDDYSRSGDADTYRVASRYLVSDTGMALHGAIGTGFRAPALSEIAAGFGFNPNLKPEESFGWEVGAEQRLFDDRVILDATYFRNDFDNLINFPAPTFSAVNIDTAFSGGVELTGTVHVTDDTVLSASYTNTKTRDNSTGMPLLRRPRHKATATLGQFFQQKRAFASLNYRFVGERSDFGAVLGDYQIVDASGWYQITDNVRLFARVDNVTDTNYQQVLGFNTAPLSAYGGVIIELGGGR